MNTKTTNIKQYPFHIEKTDNSPIRKTTMLILERDLKNLKNIKVLEVGCGGWDYAKRILEKKGCEWYAFEPVNTGKKNLTLVKGSVGNIPYHNGSFDLVLCNQTMEHWFEYGVGLRRALKELNRVLKHNGVLMINAPIHFHGDPLFLSGKLKNIYHLFDKKIWKVELFEKCFPLKKIQAWKKVSANGFFSKFGYPNFMIPNSKNATSYLLNIHCKKIKKGNEIKENYSIRCFLVMFRFIKKYLLNLFF